MKKTSHPHFKNKTQKLITPNQSSSPLNTTKLYQDLRKHPEILAQRLHYLDIGPIHGQWIKSIWGQNDQETLLLLAHRNSYKSTAVVTVGVIWFLIFHPEKTIMLVRKEGKVAIATLERIKQHYKSSALKKLYKELRLPIIKILKQARQDRLILVSQTEVSQEGSIEVASVSARGITGRHYDRIHLDDVVTEVDRDSLAERERTIRFFSNLISVIKPNGKITATGTPWHPDDVYSKFDRVLRYPVGSIHIPTFNQTSLDSRRKILPPNEFTSQYLLTFHDREDALFTKIQYCPHWDHYETTYAHIDAAFGGADTSAFTIIQHAGLRHWTSKAPSSNEHYIRVFGIVFSGHIRHHYSIIFNLCQSYNVQGIHIETNADKGATQYDLNQNGLTAWGYHEKRNKHTKINTILYPLWNHLRFHPSTSTEYLKQIREYNEHAKHDDAPDSLASILSLRRKQIPSGFLQTADLSL